MGRADVVIVDDLEWQCVERLRASSGERNSAPYGADTALKLSRSSRVSG
jgi:hypothetical protein